MANITPVQLFPGYQLAGGTALSVTNAVVIPLTALPALSAIEAASAAFNCGRSAKRDRRRFIANFVTEVDGNTPTKTESIELACRWSDSGSIKLAGQLLASQTGLFCIGYTAESYDKFHKVL
ncbi:MAG: hypothetical protein ACRC2R_01645 [Xenococcaceae cyanobacterium]